MTKKNKSIGIILTVIIIAAASVTSAYLLQKKNSEKQNKVISTNKEVKNTNEQSNSVKKAEPVIDDKKTVEQEKAAKNIVREFKEGKLKYNDKGIPVLYYHSIDYEKGNELRLPKEKFREQMKYLKDNNYTTLTLNELYEFLQNNKPVPEKSVVITLDDGYEDNYTNAFPVLKEFGFKAVVFMITDNMDNPKYKFLTSKEANEMDENGVAIESHTVYHDKLSQLSYEQQLKTLKDSKEVLTKTLNKKVDYICYPYGMYNNQTVKAAKEAGYTMGFTTVSGWADKHDGIYTLNRVYINAFDSMDKFIYRLTNSAYDKK